MKIFHTTQSQSAFQNHISSIDTILSNLTPVGDASDLRQLEQLKANFIRKIEEFFREERKLNIGVIGQVKAGKSSFLNSLLFNGQTVLPKASTPKTATLTKIEYSPVNKIEIEYYSLDEWDVLEDNAAIDLEDEMYVASRELVKMAQQSGIDFRQQLAKGKEVIKFASNEELLGKLNDYVGENGKYTSLVKAVTLCLDKEELKEISIVDTPGLNDPIVSRTIRTKEFIEVCDVVFFLSQAGSFLDSSDWMLLSSQLPQKGAKQLVLIASKYDSALRDVLRHKDDDGDPFDSLDDDNEADTVSRARELVAEKLRERAREQVRLFVADLKRREAADELITVISGCKNPLLLSSMAYNMSNKSVTEYDREELNVYQALQSFSDDIDEDIKLIGDFSEIKQAFQAAVAQKEALLTQKATAFVPNSLEELRGVLGAIREREQKRLAIITNSDMEQVAVQKKAIESQIHAIKSEIISVVGEVSVSLETKKSSEILELRRVSTEYSHINDKTGTRTKTGSYSVSTSQWYNPFSWGSSRTEYYTYQETYTYLDVSDALDNIHRFSNDIVNRLEAVFSETANVTAMKRKMLNVVVNNFDTAKDNYDAAFFKLLTEKTLNQIEFPIFKFDFSEKQNAISAKFSGEITASQEKTSLNQMLSQTVSKIFDEMASSVESEIHSFKSKLESVSDILLCELLKNIEEEFEEICNQFADKENQMQRINKYIACLTEELKKL
ncbi:MAG: dynamin family protein [Sporomusaceae bacterium]|nr:dynamin family protein [Sporomusaceae bacterium]